MSIKRSIEFPKRIIDESNIKKSYNLLRKKELQIGLSESSCSTFFKGSYVLLDFGLEFRGKVRILTSIAKDCKCRLRLGESVGEANSDISYKNSTNEHSIRDSIIELVDYSDMTFLSSGFRFVRLDVLSGSVAIKSIVVESEIFSKKPIYSYNKSDETIKTIFNVAKRTIDLCSAGDFIWDGIKRDRLVWIGDLHPEMLALTALYGKVSQIEKSLTFVKKQTGLNKWVNGIATYSLWWIIILADYYKIVCNKSFVNKNIGFINSIINQLNQTIDENGNINFPWDFLDWPTSDKKDLKSGERALCIIALNKTIELFNEFNINTELVIDILNRLKKCEIVAIESKSVAALKYFAVGLNDNDKKLLLDGGANNISTFMSYYILTAIASFDKQKAIEIMKEYFNGMISLGATTFFEDFNIKWLENASRIDEMVEDNKKDIHGDCGAYCYEGYRHSLCHGWASGVIKFIKDNC